MDNELNLVTLAQHFSNEDKAREFLEKLRWPDGPECPHCGEIDNAYRLEPKPSKKDGKNKHVRAGVWKCGGCRKQFTVTVGTIFSDSHIPPKQVAARLSPSLCKQEGYLRASASPDAQGYI